MSTAQQLPAHHQREPKPIKRHHSAGYYVNRVRDSLTTRISKIICGIFLTLLFIGSIAVFITWLSLRPHRPRILISNFFIPGLDQPDGFENAEISFNVTARNANRAVGYYYDSVEAFVYYRDRAIGSTPLVDSFYQEPKNTTILFKVLKGATLDVNSDRWRVFRKDRARGAVVFRLDVTAMIRFKLSTWDSKHHRMHANCDVAVGRDGSILATSKNKRCPVYFT
ncbi:protein NDR1-like [Populus alba x Populus x berolinensis]|nr:protein NDR1-like [Populus alba x Populus x berolinensis]